MQKLLQSLSIQYSSQRVCLVKRKIESLITLRWNRNAWKVLSTRWFWQVASVLLENGASLTSTTKKGFTPLHLAAKYGNLNVAKLLLQKDAPVDAQGKVNISPLWLCLLLLFFLRLARYVRKRKHYFSIVCAIKISFSHLDWMSCLMMIIPR